MSTRWKPKNGERYWYIHLSANGVTNTFLKGSRMDKVRARTGNCFKTKREAEATLKKINKVLMEVHDEQSNF